MAPLFDSIIKTTIMTDEIRSIIEKNLPAQVGETLRLVLEKGEKDAAALELANKANKDAANLIDRLNEQIAEYRKLDSRNAGIEAREKAVADKERSLKIAELEYQLQAEKDKAQFGKDVAMGLVRNTEYRRTLFDNVTEPSGLDHYGNQQYANKTQNSSEEKTAS